MSFGFSPADILTGIKTCEWLYTNCFDKNNAAGELSAADRATSLRVDAVQRPCVCSQICPFIQTVGLVHEYQLTIEIDERYKQFGNDVKLLEARLEQLMRAFQQALNRYEQPDLDARDLRCDLKDIVGDFQQTIDQSVEVLNKHVNLRRNRAGSIDSIIWAPNSQDKIDALGRRIQFHTQKIYLVMEPVTLGLLATIDARADEIQYLMRTYFAIESPLPPLPIWLDSWLQDTILENPPPGFSDIYTIPLKDGFDALYSHFRESTYAFRDPETADQTVEQYLNLLKSQWLLEVLRNGQSFQNARPGSLYPRTLAQLEQRIMNQYRRQDIVYFNDDYLRQLSRTAFLIWPPEEEVVQNKFMTDPNVGEEEILKISVPNYFGAAGKDNLVVFRTGPATLRIVRSVQGDRSGTPYYESERFNIHIDRYIPFYAIAENLLGPGRRRSSGAVSSVGIYRGNETGETSYDLKEEKDMLDFQRAVTGYQVVFDNNPAWALNHSPKLSRGKGKVQIWHWKPLTQDNRARRDSISSSSSATSGMSQLTGATATVEMVLKGRDRSRISIHERPETNDATLGASTPPLPIIMVYSREGGEYSYYHIELGFGMQIVETACDCNKNSKTCRRSVIEKRRTKGSESNFQVRRVTTDLSAWNLSLFAHPRHPNFDNRKIMQSIDCKFLNLDFDTVADREDFTRKFNKALQLRDSAEVDFRRICNRTSFLSEKSGEVKINEPERKGGPLSRLARSSTGSSFRDRFSYRSELASDSDTVRPIEISGMPAPPVELHGTSLPSIGISGMPLSPVELHGTSLPSVGMPIPPVELHGTSLPRLRPISRVSSFNIKGIGGKFFG